MDKDILDRSASAAKYRTEQTISLAGLRFGTDYTVQIQAVDMSGNLSLATSTSFKTLYAAEALENLKTLDNAENFQDQLDNIIDSVMPSLNPPYVGDLTVESVSEDTAVLVWKTNTKAFGSLFYVESSTYDRGSTTESYKQSISDTSEKTTTHRVTLSGLKALTTYHAMATSFAIFGVNGQSKDISFTTKAAKVLPEITAVGNTNFTVFWKTTEPTTSILEYKDPTTGRVGRAGSETLTKNHSVSADNLKPNTTYSVLVSGTTAGGHLVSSPQAVKVRTKLDSVAPKLSNVTVSNAFIPNKADRLQTVITWKSDEKANSKVTCEEGAGFAFTNPDSVADLTSYAENHALVISRFKPGTIYRFQISSVDEAGNVASSSIKSIFTPRADESVFNVIIKNFEDSFGYLKNQ